VHQKTCNNCRERERFDSLLDWFAGWFVEKLGNQVGTCSFTICLEGSTDCVGARVWSEMPCELDDGTKSFPVLFVDCLADASSFDEAVKGDVANLELPASGASRAFRIRPEIVIHLVE